MRSTQKLFILLSFLCLIAGGCAGPPLSRLPEADYPVFHDDLDYRGLEQALRRSLDYLQAAPRNTAGYLVAGERLQAEEVSRSLALLLEILEDQPDVVTFSQRIKKDFDVYQARGVSGWNPRKKMLVTGYYQPAFMGSLEPDSEYAYPLYRLPDDLVTHKDDDGKSVVHREVSGSLTAYWTRREIEQNNLLRGSELVWLKSPVDAFILHVQGSGLIRLPDGSVRGVHFAGRNGRPYRSIGKYMVDTGRITLESASLDTIRSYIESHPQEQDEILHHNQSFIFFHWTKTHGAVGSLGKELTPGRSIAADREVFPPGALAFLETRQPDPDSPKSWKALKRFVTVQDTGSAIKGPGRVDLFWGTGDPAGQAAGKMKESGLLYLLLPKDLSRHGSGHEGRR